MSFQELQKETVFCYSVLFLIDVSSTTLPKQVGMGVTELTLSSHS